MKLLVAGRLNLALHHNTQQRGSCQNKELEKLISNVLGSEGNDAELYAAALMDSGMTINEVYDTLFRWMGETKVLIETVNPADAPDLEKLESLHSRFSDARYIWESTDPRTCRTKGELDDWYSCHSTLHKFFSTKYKHTWIHVPAGDIFNDNCSIAETVTECIGVFFSRHYDKMLKSLSKFESKNPIAPINTDMDILDERIIKLSSELGYNLTQSGDLNET